MQIFKKKRLGLAHLKINIFKGKKKTIKIGLVERPQQITKKKREGYGLSIYIITIKTVKIFLER